MARTLAQIVAELNPTYQAQTESLQQQQSLIPQQVQSQETAVNAQKDVAYEDIVSGARRRGLGFSGIPLGEQAKYAATTYAPALANLRFQGQQKAMSLQDAILGINERRDTLAQSILQQDQNRDFQLAEAEKERQSRAAASSAMPSFGGFSPSTAPGGQGGGASIPKVEKTAKGYAFYDAYGKPINAAEYVQLYNKAGGQLGYRQLLQKMAADGDKNAKVALQYVGDDFRFGGAPSAAAGALSALGAAGNFNSTNPVLTSTAYRFAQPGGFMGRR